MKAALQSLSGLTDRARHPGQAPASEHPCPMLLVMLPATVPQTPINPYADVLV